MFAVIEQKEPHAGRMAFEAVAQPATFAERCALARRIRDELELPLPIFVDGMDDASRALFSDLPGPAFVLDRGGRIVDKQAWVDPEALALRLERLLASESMPGEPNAAATLAERDVAARRLLAAGANASALAWLAVGTTATAAPPSPVATAHAAITRALALPPEPPALRSAAFATAATAVAAAWPQDALRRAAAYAELAQAAAGTPSAERLWQLALEQSTAPAPDEARAWLTRQRDAAARR